MKFQYLKTAELLPHIDQKKAIPLSPAEFNTLKESIEDRGIIDPLIVNTKNEILDGVHRWKACNELEVEDIPCLIVESESAASIMVDTTLARRQLNQGAKALMIFPLIDDLLVESKARRTANLNNQESRIPNNWDSTETQETLAEKYGVNREYLSIAGKVWNLPKDEREDCITKVFTGDISLPRLNAALAGRKATKGKKRKDPEPEMLLSDAIKTLGHRLRKEWPKITDRGTRNALGKLWDEQVREVLPPELEGEV